jgi:pimeloyl-ACP methyl ester carboxylesterase
MLPLGQAMQAAGFSVLIPDYRGYGGTVGRPTTAGVFEDASLSYASLQERMADSLAPIVVIGHSMGTALAARLARENAPAATVYMSPFTRISTLVRSRAGAIGPRLFDTTTFAFNPLEDAALVAGRSMVVVAGRDLLIGRSESDAFVAGLPANGGVIRDPKASHNGVVKSPLVLSAVTDSMRAWTGCEAAAAALRP